MSDNYKKLREKLSELFQLDQAELDFGIYRIMNMKREEVEDYLDNKLQQQVKAILGATKNISRDKLQQQLENAKNSAQQLGVAEDTVPRIQKIKQKLKQELDVSTLEQEIFSDLYNFFSRYYEDGDFVSQRRYKKDVYAVPYEGEEVKLHWANSDQYYIKTAEYFNHYRFVLRNGIGIEFRLRGVKVEQNNNKGKRKAFVLCKDTPIMKEDDNFIIWFEFIPIETGKKQENINQDATKKLKPKLEKKIPGIFYTCQRSNGDKWTVLEKHLNHWTKKNTFDYFIHKDLESFLKRELDFFIKNEILYLDDIVDSRPDDLDKRLAKLKALKEIGQKIITFLAQLEEFQKKLWLKKKFVVETNYCLTLDKVPENFYGEIAKNKAQINEWVHLFAIDEIKETSDLKANPHLVLDTVFFDTNFKYRLLGAIGNVDEQTDGLLVHSENFQALNLLQEKYKERVKCIYIDPPFNTGGDFLYRDSFRFSSWCCLIENRIALSSLFLAQDGNYFLHLDENANHLGKIILGLVFPSYDLKEITFSTNATKDEEADLYGYKSSGSGFTLSKQSIFHIKNSASKIFKLFKPNRRITTLGIGQMDLIGKPKKTSPKGLADYIYGVEEWNDGKIAFSRRDIPEEEKIYPLGDIWNDIYSFTQSEMRISESLSFTSSQKPEHLMRRLFQSTTEKGDLVLDFFAGIGTSAAVGQKLGRRWITVEMGEHFENFYFDGDVLKLGLLGRLKNVLYGDRSFKAVDKDRRPHLSKDVNWEGGGMFKYIRLESYEDTLDNLKVQKKSNSLLTDEVLGEQYFLSYMLELETKDSLLNIEMFEKPFDCELSITRNQESNCQKIDLVETFNYLIGLYVEKMRLIDNVLMVQGTTRKGEKVLVLWRDCEKVDHDELDKWFGKHRPDFAYDWLYVNGDNNLEGSHLIEAAFHKKMFA